MVNILHLNTSERGGAARIALTLHKELNFTNKYSSIFAYGRGNKYPETDLIKFGYITEVYSHAIITRLTGLEGWGTDITTKDLIRVIERNKFDIIHLHNLHGYFLNFHKFVEYCKITARPVIWTLHDCWALTGSCAMMGKCLKYLSGCGECPNKAIYPSSFVDNSKFMWSKKSELFSSGWSPILVTPSEWLAGIVRRSYLSNYQIQVIPNGIDVDTFKPTDRKKAKACLGIPPDKKVILFVASKLNDKFKGLKHFLDAVRKIDLSLNYQVVTVGQKIKGGILCEASILQLGYIKNKQMLSMIYNAADVYCTTSLEEVFGLTVTEAMACGTPIAGFNVGGIPEQVSKECGILVDPLNIDELSAAIGYIISEEGLNQFKRETIRNRALNYYSSKTMVESYSKLYDNMLKISSQD